MILLLYFKEWYCPGVYVLMLHRVCSGKYVGLNSISINKEKFIRLIDDLQKYFDFVDLSSLAQNGKRSSKYRPRVLLTFDDAYSELIDSAIPVLEKNKIPYVMYPVTDYLEQPRAFWWDILAVAVKRFSDLGLGHKFNKLSEIEKNHSAKQLEVKIKEKYPDLEFDQSMNWEMLKSLRSPAIIGNHGHSHALFSKISETEMDLEISKSNALFKEQLLYVPNTFAYPAGGYNDHTDKKIKNNNFEFIFTTDPGRFDYGHSPFLVPRFNIDDEIVSDHNNNYQFGYFLWNLWRRDIFKERLCRPM